MAASATFLDSFSSTATVSSYSKTVAALFPSSDRIIVVTISGRSAGTATVTSVDIGGAPASQVPNAFLQSSGNLASVWYASVPTGTSLAISVNFSNTLVRGGFGVYSVTGALIPTVGSAGVTTTTPASVSSSMPGVAIAAGFATGSAGTSPNGGQRTTSSMGNFVAGTVTGRAVTTATTGTVWQGNFSAADYDTMLSGTNQNPSVTAFGLFYDAGGTVSSGTATGAGAGSGAATGSATSAGTATGAGSVAATAVGAAVSRGSATALGFSIITAVGAAISRGVATALGSSTATATAPTQPVDPASGGVLRIPPVPVDNVSLDWPRKVANAVNALIKQFTRIQTNPFMQLDGEPMTPVEGQTYYDKDLKMVRTFDGSVWNNHW